MIPSVVQPKKSQPVQTETQKRRLQLRLQEFQMQLPASGSSKKQPYSIIQVLDKIFKIKRSEHQIRFLSQLVDNQLEFIQMQRSHIQQKQEEGKYQLLIVVKRLFDERQKLFLDRLMEIQKIFLSYNVFSLLVNNFDKIFKNNIHKKLAYSFNKIYYHSIDQNYSYILQQQAL